MRRIYTLAALILTWGFVDIYAATAVEVKTSSPLPEPIRAHSLSSGGGYLYNIGGLGAQGFLSSAKTYYARISGPGQIEAWISGPDLPKGAFFHSGLFHNGRLYVLGGHNVDLASSRPRPAQSDQVYISDIGPDGAPGPWRTTAPMPEALVSHAAVVSGSRLYVIGGWRAGELSNRVYAATMLADGNLANWEQLAALPDSLHSHAAAQNGTIYTLGGVDGESMTHNLVYRSHIEDDGTLSAWGQTTPLPEAAQFNAAAVVAGRIVVSGGDSDGVSLDSVYSAPILSDTKLGDWELLATIPQAMHLHAAAESNGAMFLSGGFNGSEAFASVYSITMPKEQTLLSATMDVSPSTITLQRKTEVVRVYLSFPPENASASDIDPASVRLVGINDAAMELAPDSETKILPCDYPSRPDFKHIRPLKSRINKIRNYRKERREFRAFCQDGIARLRLAFKKKDIRVYLNPEEDNTILVAGRLTDGKEFSGSAKVWTSAGKRDKHEYRRKEIKRKPLRVVNHHLSNKEALAMVMKRGGRIRNRMRSGVDIPEGAIDGAAVTVTEEPEADSISKKQREKAHENKKLKDISKPVEYGPHGTWFKKPVTLTIAYNPDDLPKGITERNLSIHYWNPQTSSWDNLRSIVDRRNRVVRAQTEHFSLYQVLGGSDVHAAFASEAGLSYGEVYAFPNPATRGAAANIHVEAGTAERVDIHIYDLSGKRVHSAAVHDAQNVDDGSGRGAVRAFEYPWNTGDVGSGVYIYAVTAHRDGQRPIYKRGKVAVVK